MKKILLLATFVATAFVANAQCSGAKAAVSTDEAKPKSCCAAKAAGTCSKGTASADAAAKPVTAGVVAIPVIAVEGAGETKKSCSATAAKSCTKEDMKKGCCSKKTAEAAAPATEQKADATPAVKATTGTN